MDFNNSQLDYLNSVAVGVFLILASYWFSNSFETGNSQLLSFVLLITGFLFLLNAIVVESKKIEG
jgi:hypothetical protein